jgi:signal transduction histidine kinase
LAPSESFERALILAPIGRDAVVAQSILAEIQCPAAICRNDHELLAELEHGAGLVVITEEATRGVDLRRIGRWVAEQPAWSDFPFIVLTRHGGGVERNPAAATLMRLLGNVTFLERPFHPTTLISLVQAALRGRRRQYEWRRLNEELESHVEMRTVELAKTNRQLLRQIEERERVESTLNQLQRLEAVGQLTSGVAHDFNNLLTVVLGNIGFLERALSQLGVDGKLLRRLGYIRTAGERGAKLTHQLLSFSRRQRLEPRALDLNEVINAMRDLLHSTMGGSIRIDVKPQTGLWLAMADPTQLELAVLNLAINARDAMEVGGHLRIETANVRLGMPTTPEEPPPGEYVGICVRDSGTGMTPEVRAKVFEPFFTTKDVGKGSGLGLSQVLGFSKQSGGGVRIESRRGEGTAVHLYMPRAVVRELDAPLRTASMHRSTASQKATILVVDDDDAVRDITADMLRDLDYSVLEASSGGAALDLLHQRVKIDLILIDFAMPGMNGAEVARFMRSKHPDFPIVFVTGFADREALEGLQHAHVIGKPFTSAELAEKIQLALGERVGGEGPKTVS